MEKIIAKLHSIGAENCRRELTNCSIELEAADFSIAEITAGMLRLLAMALVIQGVKKKEALNLVKIAYSAFVE